MQRKNDFFVYNVDTNKWKEIGTNDIPPSPRDRHVSVIHGRSIFIFGGYDGFNRVNDFYEYNIDYNSWQEVLTNENDGREPNLPPSPRHSHSAVVFKDCLYIFGGYDGSYKNDFHKFNFVKNTWEVIKDQSGQVPTPRYRTSTTSLGESMYVFGGHDGVN